MARRALGAAGATLIFITASAWAQSPLRIRGEIEKVDGALVTIKTRDNRQVTVKLADNARTMALVPASLADVGPGAFIGVTGMPQADGSQRAIAIHIFHSSQRGVMPDRFGPWDLQPGSTMTNAYVESIVAAREGQEILLKYRDGEKKVIVPQHTPIVAVTPAERSEVKPGAQIIIIAAQKQPDGSFITSGIYVGRGVRPPM